MSAQPQRAAGWSTISQPWDLVIVGGGITGAGILREATRLGLRTLLVEQRDFAWGTSSRSSKLVHGGFRYLTEGKLGLVRDGVRERQRLLADAPGLVLPVGFMFASYQGERIPPWLYRAGLALYDILAGHWDHQRYTPNQFALLAPHVTRQDLVVALRCREATTDDARLVFRLIHESAADGGVALNYVAATELLREGSAVAGVRLRDATTGAVAEARSSAVVNATGAWAGRLRGEPGQATRIRPLRGSHLVFPAWRLPLAQVIAVRHPVDQRYVSMVPWEDVTLVGTTDLDHDQPLDVEPRISPAEVGYLMAAVEYAFPSLGLTLDDVVATYSGVRPVVNTGKRDPSRETRDHLIVDEAGLVTVMGGKLTTFRLVAHDALAMLRRHLPQMPEADSAQPVFDPAPGDLPAALSRPIRHRLLGRYGSAAQALVATAVPGELAAIPGTSTLWAELRWAVRHEQVVRLDDLLLRRTRLGLMLPRGAAELLPHIRAICQAELGWDDARWAAEVELYQHSWQAHYSIPERHLIPSWGEQLAVAQAARQSRLLRRRAAARRRANTVLALFVALGGLLLRRHYARENAA